MQKFAAQSAASLLVDAAPAAQLLCSGYSAPKPICCGPVGRRWFPESRGSPRPAAPLGGGGAVSTSIGGRFRGARFLGRAVGPFRTGDRAPECAVCGGWRRSRMDIGWLAERPDSGQTEWSQCSMRVQHKCACVRPDRGSLTSHQDKTASILFSTCPPSTVHLQSTLDYL